MTTQDSQGLFTRSWRYLLSLLTNRYFWAGIVGLVGIGLLLYVLVNNLLMPAYTRHDVAVTVPDVEELAFTEARQLLERQDLQVEKIVQRYNPNVARDVVVDQNPRANALVKPGRSIYLTVNSGRQRMVVIPSVEGLSLREAQNRLRASGLQVEDIRPDSIPAPYQNTVTRQEPLAGDSLAEGASVVLWYSTGMGSKHVAVPDLRGLPVTAAQDSLHAYNLRAVIVGGEASLEDEGEEEALQVKRQSREPGTLVREGFEIRLYVDEEEDQPVSDEENRPAPIG